jgi:hypothetical protein
MLAEALIREWRGEFASSPAGPDDPAALLVGLAEIELMLAHVGRRITEVSLRPLFRETIEEIHRLSLKIVTDFVPPSKLRHYLEAVERKCELLTGGIREKPNAD